MNKYCNILAILLCLFITKTVYANESNDTLPSGLKYSEIEQTIDNYVSANEKLQQLFLSQYFQKIKCYLKKPTDSQILKTK